MRTGRRPGETSTRDAILEAARATFHAMGYDGATLRAIAGKAGVDPGLIHHFFGSKQELFARAMDFPIDPRVIVDVMMEGPRKSLGERLLRTFFSIWEGDRSAFIALLRSATSNEDAARLLRELITTELLGPLAERVGTSDARLRASLVGSQLAGLAMVRYVICVEPLASTDPEILIPAVAPTLQRYLTGELAAPTP